MVPVFDSPKKNVLNIALSCLTNKQPVYQFVFLSCRIISVSANKRLMNHYFVVFLLDAFFVVCNLDAKSKIKFAASLNKFHHHNYDIFPKAIIKLSREI